METEIIKRKRGRPFKVKPETVVEKKSDAISFTLQFNGKTVTTYTDNVLKSLREVDIVPTSLKTMTILTFKKDEKVYRRFLKVSFMKMLLANDMKKKMVAKVINTSLGLSGEHLYV